MLLAFAFGDNSLSKLPSAGTEDAKLADLRFEPIGWKQQAECEKERIVKRVVLLGINVQTPVRTWHFHNHRERTSDE